MTMLEYNVFSPETQRLPPKHQHTQIHSAIYFVFKVHYISP